MTYVMNIDPVTIGKDTYKEVGIELTKYAHGEGLVVQLHANDEGYWDLLTTVTVNVEGDPRKGPKVWARNSEENEGVVEALEAQGLIRKTGTTRPQGFITLIEIELTGELLEMSKKMEAESHDEN